MPEPTPLLPERRFSGELRRGDGRVSVSFGAGVDRLGQVTLSLVDVPLNNETKFVMTEWHNNVEVPHFSLTGTSEDGTQFTSEHLYFESIGPLLGHANGGYLAFTARCGLGEFTVPIADTPFPQLRLSLRGFECFGTLSADCTIGKIAMHGDDGADDVDHVSGLLAVQANEPPSDPDAWRAKAKDLTDHLRMVMSFAAGTNVSVPVTEFRYGTRSHITVRQESDQHRGEFAIFHRLDLENVFDTAVRSFFDPPIKVVNLWLALEWFTMHAVYNEVRLLCAMTALENLISSNVLMRARQLLSDKDFKRLRKTLLAQIGAFVEDHDLASARPGLLVELTEKLNELKRATIKRNLRLLIGQWSIPMHGLPLDEVDAAISARNLIVHEGMYYRHGINQTDLWAHVSAIREMVLRATLTVLGFKGKYISHFRGYHFASFPATPDLETTLEPATPIAEGPKRRD